MRVVEINVERMPEVIDIGHAGENEAVRLLVDVSAWINDWPGASVSINILRPYEDAFYTVDGTLDGGLYTYDVTSTDTAIAGIGSMEFVCVDGDKLITSFVVRFNVAERIRGAVSPEPPEPIVPWLNRALQAADDAEDAADRAETAAESIESINPRVTALEHIVETSEQTAWNQLNANTAATSTASGVTFTNNGDGTWTVTGNGTASERKQVSAVSLTDGHVYAVLNGGIDTTGLGTYLCLTRSGSSLVSFYKERLFTADIGYNQLSIRTTSSFVAPEGGLTFAPMLIDLTDIYGAGNEPTLAEFRAKYPHRVYPFAPIGSVRNLDITEVHNAQIAELGADLDDANTAITANATAITALDNAKADKADLAHTNRVLSALVEAGKGKILRFETDDDDAYAKVVPSGALNATVTEWGGHSEVVEGEIVSADVNAIITKRADTTTMQTVNIPSAVLNQYPLRSAGSVYDTISFDGEKWWHTKRVSVLDADNDWRAVSTEVNSHGIGYVSFIGSAHDSTIKTTSNVTYGNHGWIDATQMEIYSNTSTVFFRFPATAPVTVEQAKAAMESVNFVCHYNLATPIVTDITALMGTAGTDLIAMAVEAGGTVTFAQNGGTIFPVPNSVTYTVKISEVE